MGMLQHDSPRSFLVPGCFFTIGFPSRNYHSNLDDHPPQPPMSHYLKVPYFYNLMSSYFFVHHHFLSEKVMVFLKKNACVCVFIYQSKIFKNTINLPFQHMFPLFPVYHPTLPSTSLVNPGIQSSSTMNSRSMARRLWSDPSIPLISSAPGRGQRDGNSMVIHGIIVEA